MKHFVRKALIKSAHYLEIGAKRFQSAADKVIPAKQVFLKDCEQSGWQNIRPCFVLSTGRSGTRLLTDILLSAPDAMPLHEPRPELYRPSRLAYEQLKDQPEIFREVFKSAREEYLLKAIQQEKIYVETNNQCTFFAPIIRDIFPKAIFIHIVRHPGAFVRSGIRRKWYSGSHSHDIGRIEPLTEPLKAQWPAFSLIEKNGWLWNETNQYIEDFKSSIPAEICLTVKAEDLFANPEASKQIFTFLTLNGFQESLVRKMLRKPVNPQRKGNFPKYSDWTAEDKTALKQVCPLAEKYGYQL